MKGSIIFTVILIGLFTLSLTLVLSVFYGTGQFKNNKPATLDIDIRSSGETLNEANNIALRSNDVMMQALRNNGVSGSDIRFNIRDVESDNGAYQVINNISVKIDANKTRNVIDYLENNDIQPNFKVTEGPSRDSVSTKDIIKTGLAIAALIATLIAGIILSLSLIKIGCDKESRSR